MIVILPCPVNLKLVFVRWIERVLRALSMPVLNLAEGSVIIRVAPLDALPGQVSISGL
jgi:hypothetical protein